MVDVRALYLVSFASQATLALTMVLLACLDRRSRGMRWLAVASVTVLLSTAVRRAVLKDPHHIYAAVNCVLLILIFFFAYRGLRWFLVKHPLRTNWGPGLTAAAIVLSAGFALVTPTAGLIIAQIAGTATVLVTVHMLWNTRILALRQVARICSCPAILVAGILLLRAYVGAFTTTPVHSWLTVCVQITIVVAVTLFLLSFIMLFIAEGKRRLYEETRTDALTGLLNRRAMEEAADLAIVCAQQTGGSLAMLMLDLDNFKLLNDTWGHCVGDRALRALGAVLRTGTGTHDVTARMGGEEFAVLLPRHDLDEAAIVAERLRRMVEDLRPSDAQGPASLTVSVGVSLLHFEEEDWGDMLRRADQALYRAKREGRNRVVKHSSDIASVELEPVYHPSASASGLFVPMNSPLSGEAPLQVN